MNTLQCFACATLVTAASLLSRDAFAQQADESAAPAPTRPYALTARAEAGIGPGTVGIGVRAGGSLEGWVTDHFGFGAFGGASEQTSTCIFCTGTDESIGFLGGSVTARTRPRGTYGLFRLGTAYVAGRRKVVDASLLEPPTTLSDVGMRGALFSFETGLAWHPGQLEIDLTLHTDVTTWGSALVTADFGLGFAAL